MIVVNIETAEEIVNLGSTKLQKRLLRQVIQQVDQRRKWISEYLYIVDIISSQIHRKQHSLEQLIHHLDNRETNLDQGLSKMSHQKIELEKHQDRLEKELQMLREQAETCREKKMRREQHYSAVSAVPILSAQSQKRYIRARDRYLGAEQQVSESRQALEKCRQHLVLISKTVSAQCLEQDQLQSQRRGSVDTIVSSTQQMEFLKRGCEFWVGFDTYQAQVVLESAIYLYELIKEEKSGGHGVSKKKQQQQQQHSGGIGGEGEATLDVDQVWQKTFKLACFEYGDREIYGDTRWSTQSLEINFDCDLCQTFLLGWPKVIHASNELACELCYSTLMENHTADVAASSQITIIDPTTTTAYQTKERQQQDKLLPNIPVQSSSKMRKLFTTLFKHHHPSTKIDPSTSSSLLF